MYASADIEADMAYYIYRKFETCVICYCHDVWNCRNNIEEFIFIIKKNALLVFGTFLTRAVFNNTLKLLSDRYSNFLYINEGPNC